MTVTSLIKEGSKPKYPKRCNYVPKVLLAQRACVELFPPVLHQAAILNEFSTATILDALSYNNSAAIQTPENVNRIRVSLGQVSSPYTSLLNRANWLFQYAKEFRKGIFAGPDVVVAYEPEAASLLLSMKSRDQKIMRVVHLHEIPWKEHYAASITGSLAIRYMMKHLHRADIVIVPDRHRGEFIQTTTRLNRPPITVMNCPRILPTTPESLLIPYLRHRGITANRIVHYQGAVNPDHYIEAIIKSMRFWPKDAVFTIVGDIDQQYLGQLKGLIAQEGVSKRVVFIGRVPYEKVFQYAVGATVGICLLDTSRKNWEFSAGASNKRFEYAALGIPQVTNNGPGIQELFVDVGIASVADPDSVENIGEKITQYLLNEFLATDAGLKARKLHLHCYNYEAQFQPVIEAVSIYLESRYPNLKQRVPVALPEKLNNCR
ncbi:MAG: glycosyltransferase [Acidobacteria bacterium]|nr:glycosyltransferase [Acidobacteriota bacterium]